VAALAEYLDLTAEDALTQLRMLLERRPVRQGRQVTFLPVETLLCLAASFLVNHRHFGGGTAHRPPEPVPSLARLFSRPPSSVLAKMANLDGSRSHGARWDVLAGAMLRDDPARFSQIYGILLHAACTKGVGPDRLPDFLGLEQGGELTLLGQDELDLSVLEESLRDRIERDASNDARSASRPSGYFSRRRGLASMCLRNRCWRTAAASACSADCSPRRSVPRGCC
jgi:putative restriction endonuclease